MNCTESSEWISRGLDGELSALQEEALREHLAGCAACEKLERQERRLHEAVKAMAAPVLRADHAPLVREAVRRGIDARRGGAGRLSFRIMSLAAVAVLAAAVMVLSMELRGAREAVEHFTAQGKVRHAGPQDLHSFSGWAAVRNASDERGIAEQVQAFGMVQDYLGGAVRWMAVDGNQVEIGMSGSGAVRSTAGAQPRNVVVLSFQYLERRSSGECRVLSNPQFILVSGEEASVRLAEDGGNAGNLLRYRVRADRDAAGQIHAEVTFSCEAGEEGEKPVEIVSPVTASVLIPERTGVLLGASGDASCRRELYLSAVSRSMPANVKPAGRGAGHS